MGGGHECSPVAERTWTDAMGHLPVADCGKLRQSCS